MSTDSRRPPPQQPDGLDIPGFLKRSPSLPSWRDELPVHPAADLFPLLSKTDPATLKELGADIKKNGLTSPIVLWSDGKSPAQLLDGRNRLDAIEIATLSSPGTMRGWAWVIAHAIVAIIWSCCRSRPPHAKKTWPDHGIANRWSEKVDRKIHPHIKSYALISRLIAPSSGTDKSGPRLYIPEDFFGIYKWLDDGADFLVVKSDRREMLVVLPLRLALEIAKAAEMTRK